MNAPGAFLVWCPFPDRAAARDIADCLLDERLIACANILGEIESVYEWKGERATGAEVAVLFKSQSDKAEALVERLGELHPFDAPAIVGWSCEISHPATLDWLRNQLDDTVR